MSSEATRIGLACLIRVRAIEPTRRPALVGMGVLAAGAVIVLVHLAGVDAFGGLTAGQSGLLPGLPPADSSEQT